MWLPPVISFPVQIPVFYTMSRSLCAYVSLLTSKWSSFYFNTILWVLTLERRPVGHFGGVGAKPEKWVDFNG